MKKIIGIIFIILSLLGGASCNAENNKNNAEKNEEEKGDVGVTTPPMESTSNILIAYFSCTNTTKAIAKLIAEDTKGALYEITPKMPYTEEDLKYYTNCRADKEQNDPSARPAIQGTIENLEKYSIIFLGYPIWHGQAPRIISTFLESYDFSNKIIIPFCTSQSSGIGSSDTSLHPLASKANWIAGKRFAAETSKQSISDWIKSLNLSQKNEFDPSDQINQEEIKEMVITINENKVKVALEKNSSVDALIEILKQGDIVYTARDYGGFEKVGDLGYTLPTNNSQLTTQPGDVILYSGNQIVLFYGSNSWSYTKLGKIEGYSANELASLLGAGNGMVSITLSLK